MNPWTTTYTSSILAKIPVGRSEKGLSDVLLWYPDAVREMSTRSVIEQLQRLGVDFHEEAFISACQSHDSAWDIGKDWVKAAPSGSLTNRDKDFVALAACILWERLSAEKPSVEMLSDWVSDGFMEEDPEDSLEPWKRVWDAVHSHGLFADQTRIEDCKGLFGFYKPHAWVEELDDTLKLVVDEDEELARWSLCFVDEFHRTFPDSEACDWLRYSRILFLWTAGRQEEAEQWAEKLISADPGNVEGYRELVSALTDGREHNGMLPDLERAQHFLELGLRTLKDREEKEELQYLKRTLNGQMLLDVDGFYKEPGQYPREVVDAYGPYLHPYALAKVFEDSLAYSKRVPEEREIWTPSRVRKLTTDAILARLEEIGKISITRDTFIRDSEGRRSAWSVGRDWVEACEESLSASDQDFLSLAACILWERFLPDQTSLEMFHDAVELEYDPDLEDDFSDWDTEPDSGDSENVEELLRVWERVWDDLKHRFHVPGITDVNDLDRHYQMNLELDAWAEKYSHVLQIKALSDEEIAEKALAFHREFSVLYPDSEAGFSLQASIAWCLAITRRLEEAEQTARAFQEAHPDLAVGYVQLFQVYALGYIKNGLPPDQKALTAVLEEGMNNLEDEDECFEFTEDISRLMEFLEDLLGELQEKLEQVKG
ncbi:MAG: hypothetical protein QNK37_03720 [Acidobacteriota bacterium]|nr:hypothetical protein [Acidobacteriota bacterium]